MPHYHPVSYETEARIRQTEKLTHAHRHRQGKAARSGRPNSRPAPALLITAARRLITAPVAAIVAMLSPRDPHARPREQC